MTHTPQKEEKPMEKKQTVHQLRKRQNYMTLVAVILVMAFIFFLTLARTAVSS